MDDNEEFLPGLRLMAAPGHRYDHAVVKISSAGEKLLHFADALVHPFFAMVPGWYSTYDANPEQALVTKQALLDYCRTEDALAFGSHFPMPAVGKFNSAGRFEYLKTK